MTRRPCSPSIEAVQARVVVGRVPSFAALCTAVYWLLAIAGCSSTATTRDRDAPDAGSGASGGNAGTGGAAATGGSAGNGGSAGCGTDGASSSWPEGWEFCRPIVVTGSVPAPYVHRLAISAA